MASATDKMPFLIQDYRRVLVDPTYRPVLAACIGLTHLMGTPARDAQQGDFQGGQYFTIRSSDLWQDDFGTWDTVCYVERS